MLLAEYKLASGIFWQEDGYYLWEITDDGAPVAGGVTVELDEKFTQTIEREAAAYRARNPCP